MQVIVPDASILIKWVLPQGTEPDQRAAHAMRDAASTGDVILILPSLWIYEVGNTLGRRFPKFAESMIESLLMLGVHEIDWNQKWLRQVLLLMDNYGVTFYDAAYHALALTEKAVFVTADRKYVRRVDKVGSVVSLRDWDI